MFKDRLKDEELMAIIDTKAEQLEKLWNEEKVLVEELDILTAELFRRGIDRNK